jgi:hydroxymethylpyrimidine/phosphomethylpyrimidine kinase
MATRLLILDLLDPSGRGGLAAGVRAAGAFDVDAIPISTGVIAGGEAQASVLPVRARLLSASLREAFEARVDGMLIGTVPDFWQARALARALANWLPDTLVYAPLGAGGTVSRPGSYNRRLQVRSILPEATTVVLPASRAGDLIEGGAVGPEEAARALLDEGAHSVWLRDDAAGTRSVDRVAHASEVRTLDYPLPGDAADPEGAAPALAALLARGMPLFDAIERAHRYVNDIGTSVRVPTR